MSGFDADWLAAREPLDHEARSETVLQKAIDVLTEAENPIIADLGTGTGSTVRAFLPALPRPVAWHLIDNDPQLLKIARPLLADQKSVETSLADLSTSLEAIASPLPTLVATSAFLDLVSHDWLQKLVNFLGSKNLPFYAALTYNGVFECNPKDDRDSAVLTAFNRHQQTNKGFGPALGPNAADAAVGMFVDAGYEIIQQKSDWKADASHVTFQDYLLRGMAQAAGEIEPDNEGQYEDWLARRLDFLKQGQSRVIVGHIDFLALPNGW